MSQVKVNEIVVPFYWLYLGGVFTEKSSVERPVQRYNLLIRQGPSKMMSQCFLQNGLEFSKQSFDIMCMFWFS